MVPNRPMWIAIFGIGWTKGETIHACLHGSSGSSGPHSKCWSSMAGISIHSCSWGAMGWGISLLELFCIQPIQGLHEVKGNFAHTLRPPGSAFTSCLVLVPASSTDDISFNNFFKCIRSPGNRNWKLGHPSLVNALAFWPHDSCIIFSTSHLDSTGGLNTALSVLSQPYHSLGRVNMYCSLISGFEEGQLKFSIRNLCWCLTRGPAM